MEALILLALILLNGLFAMSEVALLTARKSRLEQLAKDGDRLAAAALRLQRDPTRFLSTVQIGITSVSILNGIIGDAIFSADLAYWMQERFPVEEKTSGIVATAIVVIGITYVSIVAGELVPKRIGQHNAIGIARLAAFPMLALARISAPFVWLLSISTDALLNPLLRLLGHRAKSEAEMTPEEIRTLLLEYSNLLPKKHVSILRNLFDLGEVTVQAEVSQEVDIQEERETWAYDDVGPSAQQARQALTDAPAGAQFKWRATCKWIGGTHSRSTVRSCARRASEIAGESDERVLQAGNRAAHAPAQLHQDAARGGDVLDPAGDRDLRASRVLVVGFRNRADRDLRPRLLEPAAKIRSASRPADDSIDGRKRTLGRNFDEDFLTPCVLDDWLRQFPQASFEFLLRHPAGDSRRLSHRPHDP